MVGEKGRWVVESLFSKKLVCLTSKQLSSCWERKYIEKGMGERGARRREGAPMFLEKGWY